MNDIKTRDESLNVLEIENLQPLENFQFILTGMLRSEDNTNYLMTADGRKFKVKIIDRIYLLELLDLGASHFGKNKGNI